MEFVFLNGRIVAADSARVLTTDRGLLLGDGLFETMRVYGGGLFRLRAHLARLRASAAFLRLPFALSDDAVREAIGELVRRNECPDAYVRLTVTRGGQVQGLNLDDTGEPTIILHLRKLAPYPAERYRKGAKLMISTIRQNSADALACHKTLNYLANLLARQEARDADADGAILLNEAGQVTEEAVSNIFFVRGETLYTPPLHCGLLPGITRAVVMEIAAGTGIGVEERPLAAGEVCGFEEGFLTNSLMEIMPVRSVDKRALGQRAPGKLTRRLQKLYGDLVQAETG